MTRLSNIIIDNDSFNRKRINSSFEKAHVKAHTRKTKSGILSQVKEHEDKRQKMMSEKRFDKRKNISKDNVVKERDVEKEKKSKDSPVPGLNRFTKDDWYCFAGSERFKDGSAPLIGDIKIDGEECLIIVDGQGIGIIPSNDDAFEEAATYQSGIKNDRLKFMLAKELMSMSKKNLTEKQLEELGFEGT